MLRQIYHAFVPESVRVFIGLGELLQHRKERMIKQNIIQKLTPNMSSLSFEYREILQWLKTNDFYMLPYQFTEKYNSEDVKIYYDQEKQLRYTMIENKKLYWKRNVAEYFIKKSINNLLTEQDELSPHRYLVQGYYPEPQSVIADLGAAEGSFALSVIENVKKAYLFECDPDWIEALQATFEPWKDKVVIVPKFVGNGIESIRLDDYFQDKEIDYIKADIEGAEVSMLLGSLHILKEKLSGVVVCAYHRFDDEENIKRCLEICNFSCKTSLGYVIASTVNDLGKSYFRRGIVYGTKSKSF